MLSIFFSRPDLSALYGTVLLTVFSLSISILSISPFKLAKSDFAAKLEVSTAVASFKFAFVAQLDTPTSNFTFPAELSCGLGKYWLILCNISTICLYVSSY